MRKSRKVVLMLFVFFAVLAISFVVVEHVRGKKALNAWIAESKSRGEILSVDSLAPSPPLVADNVFPKLTNALAAMKDGRVLPRNRPFMMMKGTNESVIPALSLESWDKPDLVTDKKEVFTWSEMQNEISAARKPLEDFYRALAGVSYYSGDHYTDGFHDLNVSGLVENRKVTDWLIAVVLCDLREQKLDPAIDDIGRLNRFLRMLNDEPLIISQLVRFSLCRMAYQVTWEALQVEGWTDDQLVRLQSAWPQMSLRDCMARSLAIEQAMTVRHFDILKARRDYQIKSLEQSEKVREFMETTPDSGLIRMVQRYVHLPVWQIAWADQDELNALKMFRPAVQLSQAARAKSWREMKGAFESFDSQPGVGVIEPLEPEADKRGLYDRSRYLFSGFGFAVNSKMLTKAFERETEQQIAVGAIALNRYRLLHGTFPKDLGALIPTFLAQLPMDEMTGTPLKYDLLPDDTFVLQSNVADVELNMADRTAGLLWKQTK